jgi:hypothetical protein
VLATGATLNFPSSSFILGAYSLGVERNHHHQNAPERHGADTVCGDRRNQRRLHADDMEDQFRDIAHWRDIGPSKQHTLSGPKRHTERGRDLQFRRFSDRMREACVAGAVQRDNPSSIASIVHPDGSQGWRWHCHEQPSRN